MAGLARDTPKQGLKAAMGRKLRSICSASERGREKGCTRDKFDEGAERKNGTIEIGRGSRYPFLVQEVGLIGDRGFSLFLPLCVEEVERD